jgi:hypothetical protein
MKLFLAAVLLLLTINTFTKRTGETVYFYAIGNDHPD